MAAAAARVLVVVLAVFGVVGEKPAGYGGNAKGKGVGKGVGEAAVVKGPPGDAVVEVLPAKPEGWRGKGGMAGRKGGAEYGVGEVKEKEKVYGGHNMPERKPEHSAQGYGNHDAPEQKQEHSSKGYGKHDAPEQKQEHSSEGYGKHDQDNKKQEHISKGYGKHDEPARKPEHSAKGYGKHDEAGQKEEHPSKGYGKHDEAGQKEEHPSKGYGKHGQDNKKPELPVAVPVPVYGGATTSSAAAPPPVYSSKAPAAPVYVARPISHAPYPIVSKHAAPSYHNASTPYSTTLTPYATPTRIHKSKTWILVVPSSSASSSATPTTRHYSTTLHHAYAVPTTATVSVSVPEKAPTGGMPDLSDVKPCFGPQCEDSKATMNYEQVVTTNPEAFEGAAAGRSSQRGWGWMGLVVGMVVGLWVF